MTIVAYGMEIDFKFPIEILKVTYLFNIMYAYLDTFLGIKLF